jgi:phosphatidylglycerol:prolipoprotein diacylglycerol transferase
MYPVIVKLGPVTIYSFGVLMALAFVVGGWIFKIELEKKRVAGVSPKETADLASSMALWAAVGGLIGARLLYIIEEWEEFTRNPQALIFTGAGFVWYGGLLGGAVVVSWFVRKRGLPWLELADAVAPAVAIAYGIGRLGCHVAGDGDWGTVTDGPLGVAYTDAVIGWNYPPGVRVHPTPIYEFLESLLIFGLLKIMQKGEMPPGRLFWIYLVLASLARFVVEFWRINPGVLAGLTEAQVFGILLFAVGIYFVWKPPYSLPRTAK